MSTTIDVICYKYKPLKNNEYPLKLRITKDRTRRYINLGVSILASDWDFLKNRPKPNCPNRDYIDKLISTTISDYREKVLELRSENKEFTATTLIEKSSESQKPMTVSEVFNYYISALKDEKRTGYAASVQLVYRSLLRFNTHLDLYFSQIDILWLKRYELWLRSSNKSENTIGIRFRTLRAIYNLALTLEVVKAEFYPFKKFKISKFHQRTASRAISKAEVHSIINYDTCDKGFYSGLAIDLFTFSYYMAGINFVDMAYLTLANIVDNRLIYKRRKTGKLIKIPLLPEVSLIIEKYKGIDPSYIFPIFSCEHLTEQQRVNRVHKVISKVNLALRLIGEELKLPIKLTTYVARHSYATVLKKEGISTSLISESLGHSSERVTQYYLDSFGDDQMIEALNKLK